MRGAAPYGAQAYHPPQHQPQQQPYRGHAPSQYGGQPPTNYPQQQQQPYQQAQPPPQNFQQPPNPAVRPWYGPNQATSTPGLGSVNHYPSPQQPANGYQPQQPAPTPYGQYGQAPQTGGYNQHPTSQPPVQQYQPQQNVQQSSPYGQQFVPAQQQQQQQTYAQSQPAPPQMQAAPVAPTSFTGSLFTSINSSSNSSAGGSQPSQNQMQQLFEAISTPDHETQFEEYLSKWDTYYTSYREYCRVAYDAATFAQYDTQFQAYMDYLGKYKKALAERRAARPPPPPPPSTKPANQPQSFTPNTQQKSVSGYPSSIPAQRFAPPPTEYAALRAPLRQPQNSSFGETRNPNMNGGLLATPNSPSQIRPQTSGLLSTPQNNTSVKAPSGPQFLTKENAPPKLANNNIENDHQSHNNDNNNNHRGLLPQPNSNTNSNSGSRALQRVGQQSTSFRSHTPEASQARPQSTQDSAGSSGSFFRKAAVQTETLPEPSNNRPNSFNGQQDFASDEFVDDMNGWGAETPRGTGRSEPGSSPRKGMESPRKNADLGKPVYEDSQWLEKRLREYTVEPFIDPVADARYAKMQEEKLIEELFKLRDFLPQEPRYDMGLLGRRRYADEPAPPPVVQLRPMDIPEDMDPNVAAGFDPNRPPPPKERPNVNKGKEQKGFFGKNKKPQASPETTKAVAKPPTGNLRVLTQPDASHEDEEMDPEDPFGENQQAMKAGLAGFAPPGYLMAAGLMRPQMMPFGGAFGVPFGMAGMGVPMNQSVLLQAQPKSAVRPVKRPANPSNLPPDAMEKAGHARNLMKALSQDRAVSVNELLCIINSVKTEALLNNHNSNQQSDHQDQQQQHQQQQNMDTNQPSTSKSMMIQPDIVRQLLAQLTGVSALQSLLGQVGKGQLQAEAQTQQQGQLGPGREGLPQQQQKQRQSRFEPAPQPVQETGQPIQRLGNVAPPPVPMFRGKPTHIPTQEESQPVQTLQSTVKPSQAPDLSKLTQPSPGQGQSIFRLGPPQQPSLILPPPTPVSEPVSPEQARNPAALRQIPLTEERTRRSRDDDRYDDRRRDRRSRSRDDRDRRRRSDSRDRDRHRRDDSRDRDRDRRRHDDERRGSRDRREDERPKADYDDRHVDLDRPYGERMARQRSQGEQQQQRAQEERSREDQRAYEEERYRQEYEQHQQQQQAQSVGGGDGNGGGGNAGGGVNNDVLNQLGMNEQQVMEAIERTKALFGSVMPNETSAKLMSLLESAVFGGARGNQNAPAQPQAPHFVNAFQQPPQPYQEFHRSQDQPFSQQHEPRTSRFSSPPRAHSPHQTNRMDHLPTSSRADRRPSPQPFHPLDRLGSPPRHTRHHSPSDSRSHRDSPSQRFTEGRGEVYSKSSRDTRDNRHSPPRESRESRRSPPRTSTSDRVDSGGSSSVSANGDSRAQGVLRGFFAKALADLRSPGEGGDVSRSHGPALPDYISAKKSTRLGDADRPSQQGQPQAVRCSLTPLEELIPRKKQQKRLVIILRGPPGSGKSAVAKKVKELEPEARILSIDDYFQVEQDEEEIDSRGRKTTKKVNVYRFDEKLEHKYRSELEKLFRRKIEDPHSTCVVVDAVNEKLTHFMDMVMYGTRNNFEVFVGEMPMQKPYMLEQRSTHKRSASDIADICRDWEATPNSCWRVDLTKLIPEVHKAEEIAKNLPPKISMKFNVKAPAKSKWEAAEEEDEAGAGAGVVQDTKAEWVEKPLSTEFKKKKAGVDWVEKSPSTSSAERSPNKSREKNYRTRSKSPSPDRKKR